MNDNDCEKCDYQSATKKSLKKHMASKHGLIFLSKLFVCRTQHIFGYQSFSQHSLRLHTQSKHDGLGYACGEQYFKSHVEAKYDGQRLQCEKCDKYSMNIYFDASDESRKINNTGSSPLSDLAVHFILTINAGVLRIAHLKIAPPEGNLEVGKREGNLFENR